jgi:hypothetical protein
VAIVLQEALKALASSPDGIDWCQIGNDEIEIKIKRLFDDLRRNQHMASAMPAAASRPKRARTASSIASRSPCAKRA